MDEFGFELALCARLERGDRVVARQLGGGVRGGRVLDVVLVEPGPEFEARAALTPDAVPVDAIEGPVGAGRARHWTEAVDGDRRHARRVVERAVEAGFFERERRGGREYVRQVARYPDWFDRIVAVENKPDLGSPGDLERQLRTDVSLALCDAVVLATASHVTGAHLNRIPEAVGVWEVDPETGTREVRREPTSLPVEESGVELVGERPTRTDVRVVAPDEKARARRRLAERAYGKGWRTAGFPACERGAVESVAGATLPYCAWKGERVRPAADCGPDCPGHAPGDPPSVDRTAERDRRTPWVADPEGRRRRQVGLDRFS